MICQYTEHYMEVIFKQGVREHSTFSEILF